ncbi:hypothetical protein ACF0H5_021694 [Mactra antiquata]
MKRIPNADYVKNPCNTNQAWPGVGHLKPGGHGRRNQFGLDFDKHGKTWTREFCMLDSDKDGKTNGEELGDPRCTWKPGTVVNIDPDTITHPGICEPLESDKCKYQDYWLECEETKFNCPAVDNPDTKNFTVTLPRPKVPAKETSHMCMVFEFPEEGDFHMVAVTPIIDNPRILHHIIVTGCANDKQTKHDVGELYECELDFDKACIDTLSVWALGMNGECMHENTGFRVGNRGYRRLGLQLHWENHKLANNEVDGSGVTIYYTDQKRMYDTGILWVGQEYFSVPPRSIGHTEVGHCYPECSKRTWSEDIHITFVLSHMHYIGHSLKLEHLRNGKLIQTISDEPNFIFDKPIMHEFKNPIKVSPGDELRATCSYDSSLRDFTTPAGEGYFREMCYGFVQYYPKQAVSSGPYCTSWKEIPYCKFELDDEINGCDFKNVRNLNNPETRRIFDKVTRHCRPLGPCYSDCRQVVKEISALPCYHGDMWEWQRETMVNTFENGTETTEWYRFYAGMDSCLKDHSYLKSGDKNFLGNYGSMIQTDKFILFNSLILLIVLCLCF